jgi:hypothetical protein
MILSEEQLFPKDDDLFFIENSRIFLYAFHFIKYGFQTYSKTQNNSWKVNQRELHIINR